MSGFRQIREQCFFKTGRNGVVLEVVDMLSPNLFDNNRNIDNSIFNRSSKIRFTIVDARKTKGKGKALYYNLDPNEVLLLSYLLSDGIPNHFKNRVGAFNSLKAQEQLYVKNLIETFDTISVARFDRAMDYSKKHTGTAINLQKNIGVGGDKLLIRRFALSYEEAITRSDSKWKITIEEGEGIKDTSRAEGLNIVKPGSYELVDRVFLMLQVGEVVLPINEAAKRVVISQKAFYPLMKQAEIDFTKRKLENEDYEGERIDEWNPKGRSRWGNVQKKKESQGNKKDVDTKEIRNKVKNEAGRERNKDGLICEDCEAKISQNIYNYSKKFFNKSLCMSCQKKNRKIS